MDHALTGPVNRRTVLAGLAAARIGDSPGHGVRDTRRAEKRAVADPDQRRHPI